MAFLSMTSGSVEISLTEDDVLGVGSYGKVCKAKYGHLPCAAKLLHATMFEGGDPGRYQFSQKFEQECHFMSVIKHPNIVQYLGTSRDPQSGRLALLMELMDDSLTKFLERSPAPLLYHIQLNICHDVALALSYLHSNAIIHRDLSSNNVLLIGEGSRAKVSDFGMSKLIDKNSSMTPMTVCPGATVYMPPEALTTPPHYTMKLDCFSHGVLTMQIVTRSFPNPGDAHRLIEDPKYPSGHVIVQLPETERRKNDIDRIAPDHPLLALALQCLHTRGTDRPSANEICEALDMLKREEQYTHSVEQSRSHQQLHQELMTKNELVQRERNHHQRELQELRRNYQSQITSLENELATKERNLQQERECHQKKLDKLRKEHEETIKKIMKESKKCKEKRMATGTEVVSKEETSLRAWRRLKPAPQSFTSYDGYAAVHGSTSYFSRNFDVYSFTLPDKWTKLPPCKYQHFSMAVVRETLTTIGGENGAETNSLLSLQPESVWNEVYPRMPTKRSQSTSVSTDTHLVVAGGCRKTTVEILDLTTLQWSTACSLPFKVFFNGLTLCDGCLFLRQHNTVHLCSMEALLESCKAKRSVWTRLADVPVKHDAALVTLKNNVLMIGGNHSGDNPTASIHCYDKSSNSWRVIGQLPSPAHQVLATVSSNRELVVVGGCFKGGESSNWVFISKSS